MSAEVFFENIHTGKRYKIIGFDKEAETVTLIGPHNMPFVEKYSKERFEKMGYTLKKDDAPPPPPGAAEATPSPPVSQTVSA